MDISTVLTFAKDLLITFLTLLTMFFPSLGGAAESYSAERPDELITSFAVVSDIHIETNNPASYNNFKDVLKGIKAGEHIDSVVYTGDNVMNGQLLENMFFYLGVRATMPAKKNYAVMGNHDIGNGTGDFAEHKNNFIANNQLFLDNNVGEGYYYRVVNGCYLIFLASESLTVNDCTMSKTQLDWLKTVLDEAKEKDAKTIVFNHHPVTNLVAVPEGDFEREALANLLSQYELVYIHGHYHNDMGEDNFYEDHGVKCINLPRVTETVEYAAGDGIVVEVYEDEILVRARDFIKGEWIDGLSYTY